MAIVILIVFLVGALIALLLALQGLTTLFRIRVPFVTTPDWVIDWLRTHADLKPKQTFIELGCGDARVLTALARRFPEVGFLGYELAWWPYMLARWRTRGLRNVRLERKNFMGASLQSADVLFCYLITSVMPGVGEKLRRELAAGATVYSLGFRFPDWPAVRRIDPPSAGDHSALHIYQRPS